MQPPLTYYLEARNLSCTRRNRKLFAGLGFELAPHQVLLIRGRNGSGKTSLMQMLCGLRRVDDGQLLWRGLPIENSNSKFRAELHYVGHHDGVKQELTAEENLELASAFADSGDCSASRALEKMNLSDFRTVAAKNMSAGQRRRLALARLFISQRKFWILDEPFTSLDQQGIDIVEQAIARHVQNGGMLALASHHATGLPDESVQLLDLSP